MQKAKSRREMAQAFCKRYENIPLSFIMRTLDNIDSYGKCFDIFEDYDKTSSKVFNHETKSWLSRIIWNAESCINILQNGILIISEKSY